jgi:hypothetical protein
MMRPVNINYVLGLLNAGVISWYIWTGDFPGSQATSILFIFLAIIIFLCLIEAIKPIFGLFFNGIHIAVFSVLCTFFILEGLGRLFYDQIPSQLANYYDPKRVLSSSMAKDSSVIEYLDKSPYGKFLPNKKIIQAGTRGDDFVYEWISDGQGFKNHSKLFEQDNIDIVAVGDSFTESMGVKIEDSWVSNLTEKGLVSYNLGVQGYSTIQMAGVFEHYGMKYKPKHVLIGYTASKFDRNKIFIDHLSDEKEPRFTGGLEIFRAAEAYEGNEIRRTYRYLISATYALARAYYIINIRGQSLESDITQIIPPYDRYRAEIIRKGGEFEQALIRQIEQNDLAWESSLQNFIEIKEMADSFGAKTTLLYFPTRGMVYYEAGTGEPIKMETIESKEIEKFTLFCKINGINFIDLTPVLKEYLDNLPFAKDSYAELSSLPYFSFDGHLNKVGNQIISEYLYREFSSSSP